MIVTTQNINITKNGYIENMKVINIGELSELEKQLLFNQIVISGHDKIPYLGKDNLQKKNFLKEIPPFPLDVSTAAYFLKKTQVSYNQYLKLLNTQTDDFDDNQHNMLQDVGKYTKTRYAIISLSLRQILDVHKEYKDTLLLISLLDSQNIPKDLLYFYKGNDFSERFLDELKKRSFIIAEEHKDGNRKSTFSIHRSVQKVFLYYLINTYGLQKDSPSLYNVVYLLDKYVSEKIDQEDIPKISLLLRHCEKLLKHENILSSFLQDSIKGELGFIYFYLGRHHASITLLNQSIDSLYKSQKNFYKLGRLLSCLASAYISLGQIKNGVKYHIQSTTIFQQHFPNYHLENALHLTYLGNAYRDLGQYDKAKYTLEKASFIFKTKSLHNHVGYARNLVDLGKVYRSLGDYKKAKMVLEEGFSHYKHCLSEKHFRSAWAAIHLAHTYNDIKLYSKAKELLDYALRVYEGNFSKNHLGLAFILVHLGYTHKGLQQHEKAKKLFDEALLIYKKHIADDHVEVGWTLADLGSLNSTDQNRNFIEKGLAIYEKNYGEDHTQTARVLINLGEVYLLQGNLNKAEIFFEKAFKTFKKNKHPDNYMALEALAELSLKKHSHEKKKGDIQRAQSYENQAINYLNQALETVKTNFPEDSPHIAEISLKLEKIKKRAVPAMF